MQKFQGQVGGFKVQVVDTTGAGDAFCAGVLSQIASSPDIIEVGKY
jgi:fructokinase